MAPTSTFVSGKYEQIHVPLQQHPNFSQCISFMYDQVLFRLPLCWNSERMQPWFPTTLCFSRMQALLVFKPDVTGTSLPCACPTSWG